jgi:hypothetical protein
MFDPDPDSDPEKRFKKQQTRKLMTLGDNHQNAINLQSTKTIEGRAVYYDMD